ncbi:MAG: hypothetical protein ACPGXK_03595 [Phycisphaerae bacterium]
MSANLEAIAILNELLALEQGQLALRLAESGTFISKAGVDKARILRDLESKAHQHGARISKTVLRLEGSPGMRVGDINTAHVHFQQIRIAWPLLVEDMRKLVAAYRSGAEKLVATPAAARTVGEILAEHEASLQTLEAALAEMANA